jgi:hypothetical protein
MTAAAMAVALLDTPPAYPAGPGWQTDAAACVQHAEQDPTICPRGVFGCPGWPWVATCVGMRERADSRQQSRLSWCINLIQQDRERRREPASTGGTAISQALHCAGLN